MNSTAKIVAALVAFASGIVLCNVNVYIAGYLAAIAIPREYFLFFGEHITLALLVLDMLNFAVPIFVLSVIWGILSSLIFRRQFLQASASCGCLLAMLYLSFSDVTEASIILSSLKQPAFLFQFIVNLIAAPVGVLVGWYFFCKFRQSGQQALV